MLGSFGANSFTTGGGTLENEIVGAAGLRHLGEELEITGTTRLPLCQRPHPHTLCRGAQFFTSSAVCLSSARCTHLER